MDSSSDADGSTPAGPRCFISYSHDSEEHRRHALAIAQELRRRGITAIIDQYIEHEPPLSWPQWMTQQIEESEHVLVISTEKYAKRFKGLETPGVGLGARWEGAIITGELYEAESPHVKFIPVTVKRSDAQFIPSPLRLTTRHLLEELNDEEFGPLVRQILGQPQVIPAAVAAVPEPGSGSEKTSTPSKDDPVAEALASVEIDRSDTISQLELLIQGGDHELSARAAHEIGRLKYASHEYAASISAYQRVVDYGPKTSVFNAAVEELQKVLFEMNMHFGPESAVAAANAWLKAVQDNNIEAAWHGIEPSTRLVLAQAWVIANAKHPDLQGYNKEELANSLSRYNPSHDLAPAFLATQLREFQNTYQGYDEDTWGAGERPRRFRIDYELLILMDTGGDVLIWQDGERRPAYPFLMRRINNSWFVSNFKPAFVKPGWPPTEEELPYEGIRFGPND